MSEQNQFTESSAKLAADVAARAGTWIGSADAKATGMVSVAGTLLALSSIVLGSVENSARAGSVANVSFVTFSIFSIICILAGGVVLFPRTDRAGMLRKAGVTTPPATSLSFFGDLGRLTALEFNSLLLTADVDSMRREAHEQALLLCRIAATKMLAMKISICFEILALVALAISVVSNHYGV